MSRKKKITLVVVLALFIIIIALFPLIRRALSGPADGTPVKGTATGPAPRAALNVNAMIMGYENLEDKSVITGILIPDEEVDLAFEISGMITNIYFQEGSNVTKGQLLAKVNDKPLQAEKRKLEVQMPLAEERVRRQQELFRNNAVSQESVESVTTELEKLKADIESVNARIAQTELRAPFDGKIGLRNVSEGAYASPSTIISRLTKISPLKVEFSISERLADMLEVGKRVNFTVDRETFGATIYAVEPMLDRTTFTRKARATYPNPGGRLQPGRMVSQVDLNLRDTDDALLIPSIAMVAEMGRDVVYLYKNGKAEQVSVVKGDRTASSIQILEGVAKGDTLITSGVMQLRPGMPVVINHLDESRAEKND